MSGSIARRVDDRALWDVVAGLTGLPAVLVAHHLRVFPLLAERARTVEEVAGELGIAARPAAAVLRLNAALGLLERHGDRYGLAPAAEAYLLESSPSYFGGFLEIAMMSNPALYSWETLTRAVRNNAPQTYGGKDLFETHEQQADMARRFTRAMHGHSMGPAMAWPDAIDLSGHRVLLDVGGGSGAHAIGALTRWPHLQAVLLDMAPVCDAAREFIAARGLAEGIATHVADMWTDPYPRADLHFYADIFHDWPPERGRFLARKSFESLEPGGRIVVHEMLLDDGGTGPFAVAAYNVAMLLWTQGQQYSGRELSGVLGDAGFAEVTVAPTCGYWSIVSGRKPA